MEYTACKKEETNFKAKVFFFLLFFQTSFCVFFIGLSVKAVVTQQHVFKDLIVNIYHKPVLIIILQYWDLWTFQNLNLIKNLFVRA